MYHYFCTLQRTLVLLLFSFSNQQPQLCLLLNNYNCTFTMWHSKNKKLNRNESNFWAHFCKLVYLLGFYVYVWLQTDFMVSLHDSLLFALFLLGQ